ncbi:MAG: cobyrinate a,c-diamide synthase [Roseburia sp.]|nr:cobyrinate a,c-diamide synthase [Roseburia sp.]
MRIRRILLAAPKSGSGKTAVTCALLQALKDSGLRVCSCKCGPDYIDPMFHEKVLGVPARNLDTFFTGEAQTRALFAKSAAGKDFAVLEGVMGLYDGLGGVREEGSSYHLAKVTGTPIVLVVDAKGMGRSAVSLIAGFLDYDKEHLIRGVILNRISESSYRTIKPLIEEEQGIPVAGFLPEQEELRIESRHLGLVLPEELQDIRERLRTAAKRFAETVSVERILEIAQGAEEIESDAASGQGDPGHGGMGTAKGDIAQRPVIAVARDEAFCFYYADNIRLLEENGAEIKYFSPMREAALPEGSCALLLGGGYPELYARQLSENRRMRAAVREAVARGMPVVAECGGFLYLHTAITDRDGACHEMAGVLPAACFDTGRLVRFGYIELQERRSCFLPEGERIKGHEFHYYDSTQNGTDAVAIKPVTGKEYSCMIEDETHCMGFAHLYYPSNPAFARVFVEKAARYRDGRRRGNEVKIEK